MNLLCITETWLFELYTGTEMALPKTYALLHVPKASWVNERGGGGGWL